VLRVKKGQMSKSEEREEKKRVILEILKNEYGIAF
jgi:hypothetical protein